MSDSIKTKVYSKSEKIKIVERIGNIKTKKHKVAIFTIAGCDNYIRDKGGVFLKIGDMPSNIIYEIEEYLNKHLPVPVIKSISMPLPYYSDSKNESSIKLTNIERNVLRNIDTADSLIDSVDSTNVTTSEQIIVKPLN